MKINREHQSGGMLYKTKEYERRIGFRKKKVYELYNKQGAEAAWMLGLKLGLKQDTLRNWFGAWMNSISKREQSCQ